MADHDDGIEGSLGDAFETPGDVLDRDDLCYEDKLDILQRWQSDIRASGADDDERLSDLAEAIEQLQANVALDPSKPEAAPSGKGYRPND
jgi:hypothetical protein